MNHVVTVALIAGLLSACSAPVRVKPVRAASANDLPTVQGASYLGVIFPAEQGDATVRFLGMRVPEYWTPTPDDVAKCEAGLRRALERGASDPAQLDNLSRDHAERRAYVAREIGSILEHFGEFRRQYVGVITADGARRIVLNSFPGHRGELEDEFSYWRQRFVVVNDGGFWYWRIQYDMPTGHYTEFDSNGYA